MNTLIIDKATAYSLRQLVQAYYDIQERRESIDSKLGIKKDGTFKKKAPLANRELLKELEKQRNGFEIEDRKGNITRIEGIVETEDRLYNAIKKEIAKHPMWNHFFLDIKGCGPAISAIILTEFDIHKATTVSKMWAFAGMATGTILGKKAVKGKPGKFIITDTLIPRDKPTKGFLLPYNKFLKTALLGKLGPSFLKAKSPYSEYYYNMKDRLISQDWGNPSKNPTDPKKPKAQHQHRYANRYMVKMFIKDLYVAWRTFEGLEVRVPYQEEYLGKKHSA